MSLKIVFMLALVTVVFGLPSELKKLPVEISSDTVKTVAESSGEPWRLKGTNDETNIADDELDGAEELNDEIGNAPLRFKRRVCRYIRFRTKNGKIVTIYKCN